MAWNPHYQSCPKPYSYRTQNHQKIRPWMPTDNCYRQPPNWIRPHAFNYRHPSWRGHWRGIEYKGHPTHQGNVNTRHPMPQVNFNTTPPISQGHFNTMSPIALGNYNPKPLMPQRDYLITPFLHHSQHKIHSEKNSETDLTNHQNIEPPKSPQIECIDSESSEIKKYSNLESTDFLKPDSPKTIIDSKSSEIEKHPNLESTDIFKPDSPKTMIDSTSANLLDILVSSASEDNQLSSAPSETKNDTHGELVKFYLYPSVKYKKKLSEELYGYCKGILSPSYKSSEVTNSLFIAEKAKPDDTCKSEVDFESQNCGAILNPLKDKLLELRDIVSITKHQDTFTKSKKYTLKKTRLDNKLLKREAQHTKSELISSVTSDDADRTKRHKPSYSREGTKSSKSLHSNCVKRREALMNCRDAKKVKSCNAELKVENVDYAKYLERCDAISEPKECKPIKPNDDSSTIHDLPMINKQENTTKSLDKERLLLLDASIKPKTTTMAKSIILGGTEHKKPCDSTSAILKSKSKRKCSNEKVFKSYDAPLKLPYESVNSRNEQGAKLKDSPLTPCESTSKTSHQTNEVGQNPKDLFFKLSDCTSDSTLSQNSTNTHRKLEENTSKKSIYRNSSTRCYSTSSPLETKSKMTSIIERENCRVSKSEELKSSKSLYANYSNLHDCTLTPLETKYMKSRNPVNTKPLGSSRIEGANLTNSLSSQKIPVDVNVMRSRGDARKTKQYIDLLSEENKQTKSIQDKTVNQCESSTNSSDAKSIWLYATKNSELRDIFVKSKEADSKKFARKRKCISAPLKYSEVKRMKSCYVNVARLHDSRLKHGGTDLKSSFISKCFNRHGFNSKSQATENTIQQDYSSKHKEVNLKKSLSTGRSKSRPPEGKSVKSRHTESTNFLKSSSKLKEHKLKKSLDSSNSKSRYAHLKSLDDKSAKTRDSESKKHSNSSKPDVANSKKHPYARTTKSNNSSLKPAIAMKSKRRDIKSTQDESWNLSSKSYEAKTKSPFQKVESKCAHVPLKHLEAKSIKLGGERSNSKVSDENISLGYLDKAMSNLFVTAPNPAKANLNNSVKIEVSNHIESECIMSYKNKLLKSLEPASRMFCPAKLLESANGLKMPLYLKGSSVRTHESQPSCTLNEDIFHDTSIFDPVSPVHLRSSSKIIKTKSAKLQKCVEYDKNLSRGFIQADWPNHHTSQSLIPQKSKPFNNAERDAQTTDTNSQHISNSFSSIEKRTSKATKFHRVVSSVKSHETDSIDPYTLEHCKLAKAKYTKQLRPEGISPYEAGSVEQPPPLEMEPVMFKTKKRIAHKRLEVVPMPKPIKCVKYKNSDHSLTQSIDFVTDSLKNSLDGEISTLSEPKAMSVNKPSEDYQSKNVVQERSMWTSRLKICGLHLKKEQPAMSEIRFESTNLKPPSTKSPTTVGTFKSPIYPSEVESTTNISTDCSSKSLKPITTEKSIMFCKLVDPLKYNSVLNDFETSLNYSSTSVPTRHPEECKKLQYSENNKNISEVCHYDMFSPFSSPICYSPVAPPKVDYASLPSKIDSPGPYVYGSPLEL